MLQNNNLTNHPLVSFIITAYNVSAERLTECISSVLNLSLRVAEREIIVVDDGSKNCTISEMMDISDSIIYIRKPNGGTGSARNLGLKVASGDYIQFVDGEDKLLSEAYEHCIDVVRYYSPDIVMFNYGPENSGKNDYEGEEPVEGVEYLKHNSLESNPWGYVFSSKILLDLRFDTDSYSDNEKFTTLLFLRADKIFSTSAVAYCNRRKKEKVDRKDKKTIIRRLDDALLIIVKLHDMSDTMATNDRIALQRRVAQLTMNYILNTIRWTRSAKQLETRVAHLEDLGLFPLPNRNYSKKYMLFNKLSRSSVVRKVLLKMLG